MLSLSSLAGWEEAVLASISGASGSADERYRAIERSGMYGEYPAIVSAYVELFQDEESMLEALKRALFLVWRSAMFSPDLTGIADLPEGMSRAVIEQLDAAIRTEVADEELAWMFAWYRDTGAVALELLGAPPRVLRWNSDTGPDAWQAAGITRSGMRRRGQLGTYWTQLVETTP